MQIDQTWLIPSPIVSWLSRFCKLCHCVMLITWDSADGFEAQIDSVETPLSLLWAIDLRTPTV